MTSHRFKATDWEDEEGINFAYSSSPQLFLQMLENLNNPHRTQTAAMDEVVNYTTNLLLENARIRLLVEEMTSRYLNRAPIMDNIGGDSAYWTTLTMILMTILSRVQSILYFPNVEPGSDEEPF